MMLLIHGVFGGVKVRRSLWLSPTSLAWIGTHGLLFLVGFLISGNHYLVELMGEPLTQGIGSSLVATGAAGWVLFLHVRAADRTRAKLEAFALAGVLEVFPHRSVRIKAEYDVRLRDARRIDLVAYGLSHFREDYRDQFREWSRRTQVRIILLDPQFPSDEQSLADQRDLEEGHESGKTRRDIQKFLESVEQDSEIKKENFQIRMMRAIPAINILRIDDQIFWGPYLVGQQSRNTPTILVERGGFLFESLADHFENLWTGQFCKPPIIPPKLHISQTASS
jgi:hypothetical protein